MENNNTNVSNEDEKQSSCLGAVSGCHKEKDFATWLTEDALPTTKSILAELKAINAKRDEAKAWLKENNIEITEETIQERISG